MNGNAIGILESLTPNDYNTYQQNKFNKFNSNNSQTLNSYLNNNPYQKKLATDNNYGYQNSCADTFPNSTTREYIDQRQQNLSGLAGVNPIAPLDRTKQEEFSNFLPFNDPTSDNLLDINERPMTDFTHGNMVPYYGAKQTQNMAGTGVPTGNYTDGTDINSGYANSTPYTNVLGDYTGIDSTYLHKRETGPRFSPAEQQTGYVYGTPNFRPDIDIYTASLSKMKNELAPVEAVKVGRGINLDPSIPAAGGFHEFTRILPNNVNDYKVNQLPGRVITGKFNSAGLPTSYPGIGTSTDGEAPGITKNRPNSFWDQTRYPTMTSKVSNQTNFDYNRADYQVDFKPKSVMRNQTSYGLGNIEYRKTRENFDGGIGGEKSYEIACVNNEVSVGQGPLGSHVSQMPTRSETFMSLDNNIRSKSDNNILPTGNPERSSHGFSNLMTNWYVNETDRGTVNPQNVMQLNLTRERNGMTDTYRYDDMPKVTNSETLQYSYHGNASRGKDGEKFWTYEDSPKTATKATTEYSYQGNAAREGDGKKTWTYIDDLKTTTKESTEYAYASNPAIGGFAVTNRALFTGYDNE